MSLIRGPHGPRHIVRYAIRLRREGGSLTATIPRYIVRKWQLQPGEHLLIQSTEWGLLLRPRFLKASVAPDKTRVPPPRVPLPP